MNLEELKVVDADVAAAIEAEMDRQNSHIELIASENWVSDAVMEAQGSIMTNKYAEGYPGKRYYGGCQCVDIVENLAIERAKELFDAEYVNVQPHSGAQANMAVQFALLQPGDTVMGMNLDHGGHLTHGSPVNFSGTYFHIVPYGVNDEGFIDYDKVEEIAMECKPKMIIAGASAYARTIDFPRFREIADKCGAYLMVDMAHIAGLVAAGLHPSPIHYADVVTTTTHKTLRGPRGGMILVSKESMEKNNFNFNKAVFFDAIQKKLEAMVCEIDSLVDKNPDFIATEGKFKGCIFYQTDTDSNRVDVFDPSGNIMADFSIFQNEAIRNYEKTRLGIQVAVEHN